MGLNKTESRLNETNTSGVNRPLTSVLRQFFTTFLFEEVK